MICDVCSKPLTDEEQESPREDKDGGILCDECFENEYTHRCPMCEDLFDEDLTVGISPKYLLITDYVSDYFGIEKGIYEIISYPFYRDGIIEMSVIKSAVTWVCELPIDIENSAELFYVCDSCVKKIQYEQDIKWMMRI